MSSHKALRNVDSSLDSDSPHRGPEDPTPLGSLESIPLFMGASGDMVNHYTDTTAVKAVSGDPESVDVLHPRTAENPMLHRIGSRSHSPLQTSHQPDSSTSPSQNKFNSPVRISHQRRTRPSGKGFCVLSLDGGGCRGYVSLLLLKRLLRQLQPEGLLYPYLYFDLICGTSTGGLIAILLGELHVDIDSALKVYKVLVRKVFCNGFSPVRYWLTDAGYCRRPLKRAITKILKEHGDGRMFMHDPKYDRGCHCFVTTTHCVGEQGRTVLALRSYVPSGGNATIPDGHSWTVVDAALATAAAPGIFKRHVIVDCEHRYFFEDAGAHCINNPTQFALEECGKLDGAVDSALFVSLGTGTWSNIYTASGCCGLFKNKIATLKASLRHAVTVNQVHESMKKEAREHNMSYFRINPPLGGKIGLGDSAELPAMETSVMEYFKEEGRMRKLKDCATALQLFQTVDGRLPNR